MVSFYGIYKETIFVARFPSSEIRYEARYMHYDKSLAIRLKGVTLSPDYTTLAIL